MELVADDREQDDATERWCQTKQESGQVPGTENAHPSGWLCGGEYLGAGGQG